MTDTAVPTGDPELVALVRRMAEDLAVNGAAVDGELWAALTESEVPLVGLPIGAGGAGGTVADLVAAAFECARAGAAVPLVENHLAQWIRVRAGTVVRPGVSVYAVATETEPGAARVGAVTWAPLAEEIVLVDAGATPPAARPVTAWTTTGDAASVDLAGQPAPAVVLAAEHLAEVAAFPVEVAELRSIRDLLRAAQLSGAVRGCFDLSRAYAAERHQFGVRIDSFSAVQQHLVTLAQASAITRVSVFRAAAAVEGGSAAARRTTRSARAVCDRFAQEAIRAAHQVHGAIGMTREYRLADLTRRLHLWSRAEPDLGTRSREGEARSTFLGDVWLETSGRAS